MKCNKCGLVYNGKVQKCPYCGNEFNKRSHNFLLHEISIGRDAEIAVKTIISIALINIFLALFIVDWFFAFRYTLTLYSFVMVFGIITILSVITNHSSLMSAYERIDFFLLMSIVFMCLFLQRYEALILNFVFPIYLVISSISAAFFIVITRKHIRPIRFMLSGIFHWLFSLTLFILALIPDLSFMALRDYQSIGRITVFSSFVLSSLLILDMAILFSVKILSQVKKRYGNQPNK
ncbi:MAG: hypothetical protein WC366_03435 [Bacilli bacterium]